MKPVKRLGKTIDKKEPEHELYRAFEQIKTAAEAKLFLQDLCTPTELQAMADRWRIIAPIKTGKSYRTIYETTGVSITTIGRVARYLRDGTGGYDLMYKRLEKKRYAKTKTENSDSKKRKVIR